jgi:hypothetical protein
VRLAWDSNLDRRARRHTDRRVDLASADTGQRSDTVLADIGLRYGI